MLITLCLLCAAADAGDWMEFRGPDGAGQYTGPALVTEWGPEKNVAWKVPVPGKGWSSPILVKGKLILTTAVPGDKESQKLTAVCFDAATGKQLWETMLYEAPAQTANLMHKKNSHASPTAVSDGDKVWVHFGHMGLGCLSLDGSIVWKTDRYAYKPVHGNGGSPILVDNNLVFSVDGADHQYVVALDKTTGNEVWKTDRNTKAGFKFTFSTPQLVIAGDRRMIVSPSSDFVAAYDPKSGQELWRAKYPAAGWSVITRPVYSNGLVFVQTGYMNQHLIAVDPTGNGDVTESIKWKAKKDAPNTPTPVASGEELYSISDKGMLTCYDAKSGKVHWAEKLRGNAYSASPILANGLLYITSEEGVGQVVKATKAGFEQAGGGDLKEKTFATFVPSNGAIFVRTETQLYRFQK